MSNKFIAGDLVYFYERSPKPKTENIQSGILVETFRKLHHNVWSILSDGKLIPVPEFAIAKSEEDLKRKRFNNVSMNFGMAGYGIPDAARRKK